jgi:hypothetical protein
MAIYVHCSKTHFMRSAGLILGVALTATSCGTSNPLQPSIGTAALIAPSDGAQVANIAQPITLVVQNATMTGTTAPTYTFEVATDSAFATKVRIIDAVPQGSSQTSVLLDTLEPSKDYYWHVRAQTAGKTGTFSSAFKFTIGTAIMIGAPSPISPASAALTPVRPTFTVTNGSKQGPLGAITYEFDISTSAAFTSILMKGTVPEGAGQTSFMPSSDLPSNTALFWRAFGIDGASGVQGTPMLAQAFTTGSTLWSGIQPPGSPGHAVKGNNWQTQTVVSYTGVAFASPTPDQLQLFDLMDRGMSPQAGIDWMHANGYPTSAAYFSGVNVIGYQFSYLALINGQWDLVIRSGA